MSKPSIPSEYSLETLSEAVHYNRFVYERMRPYLGRRVLELGAGIGNLTPLFLEDEREVSAIDIDESLIRLHRGRVPANRRLEVQCVSIQEVAANRLNADRFDSVVSSNVLEHIEDAPLAEVLAAMRTVLRGGGYAVHWVPAFPAIFGSLDEAFHHQRRFTKRSARDLFVSAGFEVVSCSYWNLVGFFGWWLHGRILKKRAIPRASALMFDRFLMPFIKTLEPSIWRPFGQSLLIVARKGIE